LTAVSYCEIKGSRFIGPQCRPIQLAYSPAAALVPHCLVCYRMVERSYIIIIHRVRKKRGQDILVITLKNLDAVS